MVLVPRGNKAQKTSQKVVWVSTKVCYEMQKCAEDGILSLAWCFQFCVQKRSSSKRAFILSQGFLHQSPFQGHCTLG